MPVAVPWIDENVLSYVPFLRMIHHLSIIDLTILFRFKRCELTRIFVGPRACFIHSHGSRVFMGRCVLHGNFGLIPQTIDAWGIRICIRIYDENITSRITRAYVIWDDSHP